MVEYAEIKKFLAPWNRELWYWEIAKLRQYVSEAGIDVSGLESEGLKEAARLNRKRPNLGHEEVHEFALQKQQDRAARAK